VLGELCVWQPKSFQVAFEAAGGLPVLRHVAIEAADNGKARHIPRGPVGVCM
jgi:hypothetical protein